MREFTILVGYICAAVAAPLSWYLFRAAPGFVSGRPGVDLLYVLSGPLLWFGVIAFFLAAPLAIPAIKYAEARSKESWWLFSGAGLAAGVLVAALGGFLFFDLCESPDALCETPLTEKVEFVLSLGGSGALAGLVYWTIAWVLFPPKRRHETIAGSEE